jgi:hypothetical protein
MGFETTISDRPYRIRITAHAHERMRAEDRNFGVGEVLDAVRHGRRYQRNHSIRARLGRVIAVIVPEGDTDVVVTVLPARQ